MKSSKPGTASQAETPEVHRQIFESVRLIGQGASTREIASQLCLSVNTVHTYRERLKVKLNLDNGVELVHRATQWVLEDR